MLERSAGFQRFYRVQVLVGLSVLLFMGGHWSVLMGSTGALIQLSGLSGCITDTGTGGACVQGNGLDGAGWVEISPDGNYVYVASFNSSTITTFSRNVTTGVLTQLSGNQGCVGESGNGSTCAHGVGLLGAVALSLSPDGKHLYAVSRDNALAAFSRNTTTGVLTQLPGTWGCIADSGSSDAPNCAQASILGGPRSITVSNDGANVYVGARDAGAVVIFSRNATTGALTQLSGLAGCVSRDGSGGLCAQGPGLVGARGVTISNDNQNAYIGSEGDINGNSALAVFSRNTVTGELTQLSAPAGCFAVNGDGVTCTAARGLVTVIHPAMSSDDNNLYVASRDSNSLAIFSRDTTTGALRQLSGRDGCIADSGGDPTCAVGIGLNQVVFVSGTKDGGNIYAASQVGNAIAVFSRDAITGVLTQLSGTDGCVSSDGTAGSCAIGTALDGALSVNATPDGKNVYASAYIAGSLLAFGRTVPTPTTTALTSSANPSTAGQSVTFTATVTAIGSGTPSGTVSLVDGTASIGSGTLNAVGQATFVTSSLIVTTHSITAVYPGHSTFAGSTSPAVNQVVNPVVLTSTSTALTSSLNPSNTGQPVTFTATITAPSGTPSGTVNFLDGTTTIGSGTLNGGGQATFTTSSLTLATHSITAGYAGNSTFAGSTSPAVNQIVNGTTSTSTIVTSSVNPSILGQSVTFTATVTATSGSPSGTVTFMNGSVSLGSGTLSGMPPTATLATSSLVHGYHVITAVYGGGGGFAGSTSPILFQVVTSRGQGRTVTDVTSSSNPSTRGQSVALTATVSASGGYTASSTFDGPAENPLSEGGRWTTSLSPTTTLPFQSDGNHHILVSGAGEAGVARYVGQVFLEDQYAQATISSHGGSTMEGVFVRVQSNTNPSAIGLVDFWGEFYSLARFDNTTGEFRLIQTSDPFNGGRPKAFAVVPRVGDVMRLEISGDTATAYVNGTLLGSVVVAQQSEWNGTYPLLAGGQPGVFAYRSGGSVIPQLSNFSAGDIGAPSRTAVPAGAVTFIDGTTVLGTASLNGAGQAILDIPALGAGSHTIIAVYSGDANYVGTTSPVLGQVVTGP